MKDKLLIVGAGGHGKVVADIALQMNKYKKIAFIDDNKEFGPYFGVNIIDKSSNILKYINDYEIFVAIGNNVIRENLQMDIEKQGAIIPVLIHPSVIIGKDVDVGSGTVIMAGVVINCSTAIGKGCIINTGATIDHDNIIEDYVHISPGVHLAGTVNVGRSTWIGIGSSVINNINITNNCIIGAGSVVIKDISIGGTYIGVPANKIDKC